MNQNEKLMKYDELVAKVNSCPNIEECSKRLKMTLCPDCNEVNLWTYWEGGRDRLNAEILLVGQDWGHIPDVAETEKALKQAGDARGQIKYKELFAPMNSVTDDNLCSLFKVVKGCENVGSDFEKAERNCKNVFFTNYACCYREGNTSGGFNKEWIENCKDNIKELVGIIQPKVIICLGRKAFDSVLAAAGKPRSKGSYNDTVLKGAVSVSFGDATAMVFPMAHPGAMGTLNRCKAKDNASKESGKTIGLELQKSDWKKINRYI